MSVGGIIILGIFVFIFIAALVLGLISTYYRMRMSEQFLKHGDVLEAAITAAPPSYAANYGWGPRPYPYG
jgi:hypothetical protein